MERDTALGRLSKIRERINLVADQMEVPFPTEFYAALKCVRTIALTERIPRRSNHECTGTKGRFIVCLCQ